MKTANGNEGLLEVIRSDRGLTVRVLGDGEEQSLVEQFIAVGQKLSYNGQGVWFFPPGQ